MYPAVADPVVRNGLYNGYGSADAFVKSPLNSAAVGEIYVALAGLRYLHPSYAAKKKVLSLPLYSFGMRTGPPKVPPYSF